MKQNFSKILFTLLSSALIISCTEKKTPITEMQGKVKYEVISIAPKMAGRQLKVQLLIREIHWQ